MQKGCRALLIDKLGRLLAAASDGCCYLLDAESLHQDARLILHPSQTGLSFLLLVLHKRSSVQLRMYKLGRAST